MADDGKILWKKLGAGSFRMENGRIIKPNQTFRASLEEIPAAFRDVVVPQEDLPEEKPLPVVSDTYEIRSRSGGWYDVYDQHGKKVNENAMRQSEAQALAASLMS